MKNAMMNLVREEEGQAMVEYGLIIALIAVVVVTLVATLGGQVAAAFQSIIDALPGGTSGTDGTAG